MNILIVSANPKKDSFTSALADSYAAAARSSEHTATVVDVYDLELQFTQKGAPSVNSQKQIAEQHRLLKAADHFVIVAPIWWSYLPAQLKNYFDMVFSSGVAFQNPHPNRILKSFMAERLLKGTTGRIITTQDSPLLASILTGDKIGIGLRMSVLWYCGIWPVRYKRITKLRAKSAAQRAEIIQSVAELGSKAA